MDEKLLDSYIQEFLANLKFIKRRSDSTVKEYKKILTSYKKYLIKIGINKVAFLSYLQDITNLSQRTVRLRIIVIRSFLNYLYENDYIQGTNYWKQARTSFPPESPKGLTEKQVEVLFSVIDDSYDEKFFTLLLKTGLRISEALSLKTENILFYSDYAEMIVIGKGNKERILKISLSYAKYLVKEAKKMIFEVDTSGGETYVPTQRTMQRKFKRYTEVANQLIDFLRSKGENINFISATPHSLRHTCAKNLLTAGMNIEEVRYILGHSNISTTGIYLRTSQQTRIIAEI
ncbi:MAG: tyrosine-type recombinase/integrase [Petrotogaceae bacterium]|nr:tyrosine-type recombinase/integrase [Petrotogaceae bacterium]